MEKLIIVFVIVIILATICSLYFLYESVVKPEIGFNYLAVYELEDDKLAISFPKPGLCSLSHNDILILQRFVEERYGRAIPVNFCKLGFCLTNIRHNEITQILYYTQQEIKNAKKDKRKDRNKNKKEVEANTKRKGPTLYKV